METVAGKTQTEIVEFIRAAVQRIESRFQQVQELALTESDLKCLLYRELSEFMGDPLHSSQVSGIPLHTELSWYDVEAGLRIKPDITILDPAGLRITDTGTLRLPQKEGNLEGPTVIVDVKFIRTKGVQKRNLESIRKDMAKLQQLMERHDEIRAMMIVFSKTSNGYEKIESLMSEFKNERSVEWMYATSDVSGE